MPGFHSQRLTYLFRPMHKAKRANANYVGANRVFRLKDPCVRPASSARLPSSDAGTVPNGDTGPCERR